MNHNSDFSILSRWPQLKGWFPDQSKAILLGDGGTAYESPSYFVNLRKSGSALARMRNAEFLEELHHAAIGALMPINSDSGNRVEVDDEFCAEVYPICKRPADLCADILCADGIADLITVMNRADTGRFWSYLTPHERSGFVESMELLSRHAGTFVSASKVLERMLYTDVIAYEPFMEKRLAHGDLHPGNLFVTGAHDVLASDWEFARADVELYDLAFLLGCLGYNAPDILSSQWTRRLLSAVARQAHVTSLGRDRLFDILIASRVPWLVTWIMRNDSEMIERECEYSTFLFARRKWITTQWIEWMPLSRIDSEKWVITDSVLDKEATLIKAAVDNGNLRSTAELISTFGVEQTSSGLRQIIAAYGREGDIRKIIDVVLMQEELFERMSMSSGMLPELAYTYANASLDFARLGQLEAIREVDRRAFRLAGTFPNSDDAAFARAYILRNMSILLDDKGMIAEADIAIDGLRRLYVSAEDATVPAGELARALSSRVVTLLKHKNISAATVCATEICGISVTNPSCIKAKAALAFAEKNIATFNGMHSYEIDKDKFHD